MATLISKGIRTRESSDLQTVSLSDIITETGFDKFELVNTQYGQKLHIFGDDRSRYLTVSQGETVVESGKTGMDRVKELVNGYQIYAGETANGVWFSFGKIGQPAEPVAKGNLADLLGKAVKVN